MADKIIVNKRGSLNWRDAVNGFVIAALTSGLTALQQLVDNNNGVSWRVVLMAALSGGIGYVLKKLVLDKPSVVTQYGTNSKAEEVAETIADETK